MFLGSSLNLVTWFCTSTYYRYLGFIFISLWLIHVPEDLQAPTTATGKPFSAAVSCNTTTEDWLNMFNLYSWKITQILVRGTFGFEYVYRGATKIGNFINNSFSFIKIKIFRDLIQTKFKFDNINYINWKGSTVFIGHSCNKLWVDCFNLCNLSRRCNRSGSSFPQITHHRHLPLLLQIRFLFFHDYFCISLSFY